MGVQTLKNPIREVEVQTDEVAESEPAPPSIGGNELLFGNLVSSGERTMTSVRVTDAAQEDENFERLLPGPEDFESPAAYLLDQPRESIPYFPEKEQDHEASDGQRLTESIAPLMQ